MKTITMDYEEYLILIKPESKDRAIALRNKLRDLLSWNPMFNRPTYRTYLNFDKEELIKHINDTISDTVGWH